MTWAQRLKRVFGIDIATCQECGGAVKVTACIEDPVVIKQILAYLEKAGSEESTHLLPQSRAPPQRSLFGFD